MANVVQLQRHPKRVLERIRDLAKDLNSVKFSANMNDLAQARVVPIRAVWTCLEVGDIVEEWLTFDDVGDLGVVGKLHCHVGGEAITVDFQMPMTMDELVVLYATLEE